MEQVEYEFGRFVREKTLDELVRLHRIVVETKQIDVSKLDDRQLRKLLVEARIRVGPINNFTRAIYQRKLLEILAEETIVESESQSESEDEVESIVKRRKTKENEEKPVILTAEESKKNRFVSKSGGNFLYFGSILFIGSVIFTFYFYFQK